MVNEAKFLNGAVLTRYDISFAGWGQELWNQIEWSRFWICLARWRRGAAALASDRVYQKLDMCHAAGAPCRPASEGNPAHLESSCQAARKAARNRWAVAAVGAGFSPGAPVPPNLPPALALSKDGREEVVRWLPSQIQDFVFQQVERERKKLQSAKAGGS